GLAEILQRLGKVGTKAQRLVVGFERVRVLALVAEGEAELVPRLGIVGFEIYRPLESGGRHSPVRGALRGDAAAVFRFCVGHSGGLHTWGLAAALRRDNLSRRHGQGKADPRHHGGECFHRAVLSPSVTRRVRERVAPKLGMRTECFPAPPATTTMMSCQSRAKRATAPVGRSLNPSG